MRKKLSCENLKSNKMRRKSCQLGSLEENE